MDQLFSFLELDWIISTQAQQSELGQMSSVQMLGGLKTRPATLRKYRVAKLVVR